MLPNTKLTVILVSHTLILVSAVPICTSGKDVDILATDTINGRSRMVKPIYLI